VKTRTAQSAARKRRFASTAFVDFEPASFRMSGFSSRVRISSLGMRSLSRMQAAVMTGQAHFGWSECGSPATYATASITQSPSSGAWWLPYFRINVSSLLSFVCSICICSSWRSGVGLRERAQRRRQGRPQWKGDRRRER
jgi:hypothetical protein